MNETGGSAQRRDRVAHPFLPVFDAKSRILILGSFPSVRSRETMFYYGHPQNRFWRVMSAVWDCPLPQTIEEKRAMLLANGAALWDVLAGCDIVGSSDASIRNAFPNDIAGLLAKTAITRIYTNGGTAGALYRRHIEPQIGRPATSLPSTSPANAAWSLERLTEAWRRITEE